MKRKDRHLPSLAPPDDQVIAALAEYLINTEENPVEMLAETVGLPVRDLLDRYLFNPS